jgi:hypothetical protein
VKVENPVALRFILQDELYLLKTDKAMYENVAMAQPEIESIAPAVIVAASPLPITKQPEPAVQSPVPEVKTPVISFNYLGKNLKRFLVLVHYPELEFIDDAHLAALTNIIKRKDLSIDDIVILNLARHATVQYNELVNFFKPARLLVLGKNAMPQGIAHLALNAPRALGDIAGLYSFSFGEMMDNVEYKKAFWEQMKTL